MCSVKKGVPKSFTNFTGKHCVGEIFKNTYFEEQMQMAASIKSSHDWPYFLKILDYYFYKTLSEKCPNTEFFPGPYFRLFGLNTEIYRVNLRIQSEYRTVPCF